MTSVSTTLGQRRPHRDERPARLPLRIARRRDHLRDARAARIRDPAQRDVDDGGEDRWSEEQHAIGHGGKPAREQLLSQIAELREGEGGEPQQDRAATGRHPATQAKQGLAASAGVTVDKAVQTVRQAVKRREHRGLSASPRARARTGGGLAALFATRSRADPRDFTGGPPR